MSRPGAPVHAPGPPQELLRLATVGSIDDGKSTLIGRLLHDSGNICEDHLQALWQLSRRGAADAPLDFSLVTDGLKAEREQGITIDVAYRYFATARRKFIIADVPGHEQYTRNMATGASTANLALLLVDASRGLQPQTRRHAFIAALLGVPHVVVAVNKMDLVSYREEVFRRLRQDFTAYAAKLQLPDIRFLPLSALAGDNVARRSWRMPWYRGESLLEMLENVYIASDQNLIDLRFPVQLVLRAARGGRVYAGQVASGIIHRGDELLVLPARKTTRVQAILTADGPLDCACPPMSVALALADELDISRGDLLVHRHNLPAVERQFEAMLVWLGEAALDPGRSYFIKHAAQLTRLKVAAVRYRVDINSLTRLPPAPLALNEIGRVVFTAAAPVFYDAYGKNRATGGFILIDPLTNHTVAAGMFIDREPAGPAPAAPLPRGGCVLARDRLRRWRQRPATLWLSGRSDRTALAYALEKRLFELGAVSLVLDEEKMRRSGVPVGGGRAALLRRAAGIARLANDAGLIVICAWPGAALRGPAAQIIGPRLLEIRLAESPARRPRHAVLALEPLGGEAAVDRILADLRARGIFPRPPG